MIDALLAPLGSDGGVAELAALVRDCAATDSAREVVWLRFSALPPSLHRPHHLRLLHDAVAPRRGHPTRLFRLPNGDLAVVAMPSRGPDTSAAALTRAALEGAMAEETLARVLRRYGEERFADRIARRVVSEREREPFTTSARLVELLYSAIPAATRKTGGHPAKRTFQALRIEVNAELEALEQVLPSAVAALAVGGRIAVLAYHSLEDRLVKQVLAAGAADRAPRDLPVVPAGYGPELRLLTRGAGRPGEAESDVNPRAASARLRAAVRIDEPGPRRARQEVGA